MNMNRKIVKLIAVPLLFVLGGCVKPQAPTDETKQKNHQDIHRLVVTFTPGEMQSDKFIPVSSLGETLSFSASADSHWKPDKTIQPIKGVNYFVAVKQYSKMGVEINKEYATNGEDLIHQYFFIPNRIRAKEALEWIEYRYLDTEPWDASMTTDAKVIGDTNPIGLKGVMIFKQSGQELKIWMRLLHARGSKFSSKNMASPFYAPGAWTAHGDFDLDLEFEVEVLSKN